MSIAEREAENAGPECAFQRLRLDMDDVRDAYVAGRTAEPCKEQVEAVAQVLAVANAYHSDSGFYHLDGIRKALADSDDFWSCKTIEEASELMKIASMMLEAARKAVMK